MPENVDRSSWAMFGLGIAAAAGGALMIFMPEAMEAIFDKVITSITSITL